MTTELLSQKSGEHRRLSPIILIRLSRLKILWKKNISFPDKAISVHSSFMETHGNLQARLKNLTVRVVPPLVDFDQCAVNRFNWKIKNTKSWFQVCAQPMRDGGTVYWCVSLTGGKPKISPAIYLWYNDIIEYRTSPPPPPPPPPPQYTHILSIDVFISTE